MRKSESGDVPLGFCLKRKIKIIYLAVENDVIILKNNTYIYFIFNENVQRDLVKKVIDLQLVKIANMHLDFNDNKVLLIDIIDNLAALLES